MAMTIITSASFTRLISTAPDALAMRTLEPEFRTNTIACGLVVALFDTAQALAEAPEPIALRCPDSRPVESKFQIMSGKYATAMTGSGKKQQQQQQQSSADTGTGTVMLSGYVTLPVTTQKT